MWFYLCRLLYITMINQRKRVVCLTFVEALESEKIWLGLDYDEDDIERMAEYARGELG